MIVDVHAHLFNADDLPVSGFVSHQEAVRGIVGSRALARLLDRFVQGRAPSFEADRARLGALLSGLEAAATDPHVALKIDEAAARAELEADPVLRADVEASLVEQDLELATSGQESFLTDITRAVRWVALFAQSRVDLPGQYAASSGAGVTLAIPMLVDLDAGTEDRSESTQRQQVELFDQLSLASIRGLLPDAGHLAVHPFVGFDPVRQLRHAGDGESPLELVQRAVLSHGFVGIKLYPPMGWRPTGNTERTDISSEDGASLDRIVRELAEWCAALDVPITAHASDTNYADDRYQDFGAPTRWQPLLEEHAGLRLNLGHFGGIHRARSEYVWTDEIAALMSAHDLLYADVSCQRVENPNILAGHLRVLRELQDAGRPIIGRVMLGTDWYMQAMNPEPESFLDTYRTAWRDTFGEAATAAFEAENALTFLGFDDAGNQNAKRLAGRYDEARVARPGWLAGKST